MASSFNIIKSGMQNTVSVSSIPDVLKPLSNLHGNDWTEYRKIFEETCDPKSALEASSHLKIPITLAVEFVNRCNLKCVMCWTDNHSLELANMDTDTFEDLLNELPNLNALVIGLGSELFVYKEWEKVLQIIKSKKIKDVFLSTNGTMMDEEKIRKILDANVARIEISLDAATPKTYKSIRGFDKLDVVEANIMKLIEMRNSSGLQLPLIRLCFVVQELNRNEVEHFKTKWAKIVDYISFQQLQDVSRVTSYQGKDLQFWLEEESAEVRKAETKKLKEHLEVHDPKGQGAFCSYPFNSLNVWSNGDITPCCCFFGKALTIGNVKDITLGEAWSSKSLKNLRDQFTNEDLNRVCRDCLTRGGDHREASES